MEPLPAEAARLAPRDLGIAFGGRVNRDPAAAPALAVARHKLVFAVPRVALALASEA